MSRFAIRGLAGMFAAATSLAALLWTSPAWASDIGVSPVAVHLDKANDRATVNVVNNGADPVVMQAEVVEWQHGPGAVDAGGPTSDMIVNPAVFTLAAGQSQVVRVGMRRAAQATREGTYRIVLREVPTPPKPGGRTHQRPGAGADGPARAGLRRAAQRRARSALAGRGPGRTARSSPASRTKATCTSASAACACARPTPMPLPLRHRSSTTPSPEVVFPGREAASSASRRRPRQPVSACSSRSPTDQGPYQVPVTLAQK